MGLFKRYKKDYEQATVDIKRLKEKNKGLENALTQHRNIKSKLEADLSNSQAEIAELKQKLEEQTEKTRNNYKVSQTLTTELEKTKQTVEALRKEIEAEKLKTIKDTIAEFQKAIKEEV